MQDMILLLMPTTPLSPVFVEHEFISGLIAIVCGLKPGMGYWP